MLSYSIHFLQEVAFEMEMKIFGKVYQLPLWLEKTLNVLRKIGSVLKSIAKWVYRLRGFFMAIPVVLAALYLATKNMARLPDEVGINLLANGQYEYLISRGLAVMGPLVITGVCLVMIFLSRRTVFPWLISIFSLVLPLLIYITNVFPA